MNHGPLVFLGAFFALALSWFGFVLTPEARIGRLQPTNTLNLPTLYPQARPGLARQGLEVYRANGCADCHTQQVRQDGTVADVLLSSAGTNPTPVVAALLKLKPGLSEPEAKQFLAALPKPVLEGLGPPEAEAAAKLLKAAGATPSVAIVPVGPDIPRWGKRRNVARDFLYDSPLALGSQRIGPDLANAGARLPDPGWHLRHLYAPRLDVKNSAMPPYRFLFAQRHITRSPSPDALTLPPELAPPAGYEIVPKPEAHALVAYLLSLRADAPLFEAPLTAPPAPAAATETNAPAPAAQPEAPKPAPTNAPAK